MKPVRRTYENQLCIPNRLCPLCKRRAISSLDFSSDFFHSCIVGVRIRLLRLQLSQFSVCQQGNIFRQSSCDAGIGIIHNQCFQNSSTSVFPNSLAKGDASNAGSNFFPSALNSTDAFSNRNYNIDIGFRYLLVIKLAKKYLSDFITTYRTQLCCSHSVEYVAEFPLHDACSNHKPLPYRR